MASLATIALSGGAVATGPAADTEYRVIAAVDPATAASATMLWAAARAAPAEAAPAAAPHPRWHRPVPGRVLVPFQAPAHRYGPGHRGVDLAAAVGETVVSPASGIVAFSGVVVDRPVITIDGGDGYVLTLEPVTDTPPAGTRVEAGEAIGSVTVGGHTAQGGVHLGVRLHGEYINPLLLLEGIARAVLLPCC